MKTLSKEELLKYNGIKGITYIACYGKAYDVSSSYHWRKGIHRVTHNAGRDLTKELEGAPHDITLLEKFPVVGKLIN